MRIRQAGYAWSETVPKPRTISIIARELRNLLRAARVDLPFVLAGHSLGGLVVQLYAARYPDQVAGMVLVDSSHSDVGLRPEEVDAMNALGRGVRILAPFGFLRLMMPVPAGNPESRESSVRLQERPTKLSAASEWHVADDAGHFIHQDVPEIVVDAIRRVVEAAQTAPERIP